MQRRRGLKTEIESRLEEFVNIKRSHDHTRNRTNNFRIYKGKLVDDKNLKTSNFGV